jgi:aryl-alcohol dehydrogenase-like predicted oxidoreductase
MEPQRLSLAGTEVARMGLGTNRLAHTPEHVELIREAAAAGVGVIDTAHTYVSGESEQTIGEAQPQGSVVATKGGHGSGRPDVIAAELDESLRRLRTESIDLYYFHRPDPEIAIEESLGPIRQAVDEGKVRNVGVSQFDVAQIERARAVVPVAAVQNHYSYTERGHDDVVDYCTREELVFVPYFPLRGVSGGAIAAVAARHEATEAQIALAWLLHRSPVVLPIPGTLSAAHLRENLAALRLELGDDDLRELG